MKDLSRHGVLLILAGLLAIAAGWKMLLVVVGGVPFNADEAVVALMARHILQGSRPVFFYGQAYMGSLDAFLAAGGFLIFGQQVWVIRAVQALLYLGVLFTTFWLGREAWGSARSGLLGVGLLAIPVVNVTLYTTASLGGYGESLLIGNLLLLIALRQSRAPGWKGMALWGFLAGLGFWANGLTLVYSIPGLVWLSWRIVGEPRRRLVLWASCLVAGGLLGALPWWTYAISTGMESLVLELLGSAVSVEQLSWPARTGLHLVNLILLGLPALLGLRPPWAVEWLALPLLPFALAAWIAVFWFWMRKLFSISADRSVYWLFAGIAAVLAAGFLFTGFGVDPSGRYFLPLAVPLALIAAERAWSLQRIGKIPAGRWGRWAFLGVLIVFQTWGNLQTGLRYPPGMTTQFDRQTILDHRAMPELIAFLKANGETRGYSSYWVSYPLAFLSSEELIFAPRLPYHADLRYTSRDDRYPFYTHQVASAQRTAYISSVQTPALDAKLRSAFLGLGVDYEFTVIGDYHVFHHLTRPVHPVEIGLGEDTP